MATTSKSQTSPPPVSQQSQPQVDNRKRSFPESSPKLDMSKTKQIRIQPQEIEQPQIVEFSVNEEASTSSAIEQDLPDNQHGKLKKLQHFKLHHFNF